MVQIIEENRKPTFLEKVGVHARDYASLFKEMGEERKLAKEHPDIAKLPEQFREMAFQSKLRKQEIGEKLRGEREFEGEDYQKIENAFGKDFADVWKAAPIGGRTELLKGAIDLKMRGVDINEMLKGVKPPEISETEEVGRIPETLPQVENGKIPKDFKWPDFNKRPPGYTPKTWADQKSDWRKENVPVFTKNSTHLSNLSKDIMATKSLTKINETRKLPEDFERLLVNPSTGDLYGIAEVLGFKSPEAQQWSKIIAQFQNRAKEAFGSRVTNFDLQSYMKQFPGLLNTHEGRKRILRMMDINWKLDEIHAKALDDVYKHYGLNGIPIEKADELARKMIEKKTDSLKEEYENLDFQNEQESGQLGEELSGKELDVYDSSGKKVGTIDRSQVGDLPEGYTIK